MRSKLSLDPGGRSKKAGHNKMGILSNAPQGFASAVAALNSLPKGILSEMCQDVVAYLQHQAPFFAVEQYALTIETLGLDPQPDAQACVNALVFLFRLAASEKLSADALVSELKSSMEWSDAVLAVVSHTWKEQGPALSALPSDTLSEGKLVSMDWKLATAISSSKCRSLNSPYVSLRLRVAEPTGDSRLHTVELSIAEFQNFAAQLREMASTMETIA